MKLRTKRLCIVRNGGLTQSADLLYSVRGEKSKPIFRSRPRDGYFFLRAKMCGVFCLLRHRMNVSAFDTGGVFMNPKDCGDIDDLIFADEEYRPSAR